MLRTERLRIVASLIRTTGDWDLAEDAVADAAERAILRWREGGVPANPGAWLTTTRRAVDLLRRRGVERRILDRFRSDPTTSEPNPSQPNRGDDDRLRLVFTCCHPALTLEAQVALTLKVVSGLSTDAVARAFLLSEATMGQRLLRPSRRLPTLPSLTGSPVPMISPSALMGCCG